ncbi:aquaporin-like protein [Podospora aff. communis PSN243]|uniref:Aquaporin-like protein n=1 Tax=Podospora aff. communis PSN243 TaxID=3040156 RepID=A0AAV9G0E2_9PEZI|nr:aquaporin-like protein [Podospora aff. communis PSN243]
MAPRPSDPTSTLPLSRAETEAEQQQPAVAAFQGTFAPDARPPLQPGKPIPFYRDRVYWTSGWTHPAVWRSAMVEGFATAALVFVSGQIGATLMSYETNRIGLYIVIVNALLLTVFIYATAPASGGHINPMITFSTLLTGLCPFPRAVLYICAQIIGASVGGAILLGVFGYQRATMLNGTGCFFDSAEVEPRRIFLNEVASSFVMLYLAYGVGLDPRQSLLFGPKIGPLLVAAALAVMSFASSSMIPGYSGSSMNPARCFGLGVLRRDLSYQWIWWFGPATAAAILCGFYNVVPPHHAEGKPECQESETRVMKANDESLA